MIISSRLRSSESYRFPALFEFAHAPKVYSHERPSAYPSLLQFSSRENAILGVTSRDCSILFSPGRGEVGARTPLWGEDSGTIIEARNFRPRLRYHGDNRSWRGQILDKRVGDGILYAGEMTIMRIVQKIQQREFIITCNRRLVILICLKFCGFQRKKSGMGINIERKVILFFSYYFMWINLSSFFFFFW